MQSPQSTQVSTTDRAIAISLATFSTFILGYTATRVYLSQSTTTVTPSAQENVIPHQATLWSDLGS